MVMRSPFASSPLQLIRMLPWALMLPPGDWMSTLSHKTRNWTVLPTTAVITFLPSTISRLKDHGEDSGLAEGAGTAMGNGPPVRGIGGSCGGKVPRLGGGGWLMTDGGSNTAGAGGGGAGT